MTTTLITDTATGTQVKVTLANGLTRTSVYNKAGDLISITEAGSGVTTATTTYAYDNLGPGSDVDGRRRAEALCALRQCRPQDRGQLLPTAP